MNGKRIAVSAVVLALVAAGAVVAQDAASGAADMRAARQSMADRDYAGAARQLDGLIRSLGTGEKVEEAWILLIRARIGLGDYEAALEAGRNFLGSFPESDWREKARYLMADAWTRMRDFRDSARIYRERADFLSGDAHLAKVANYYLDLARQAFEGVTKPDEFGRPVVVKDYRQALSWYRKAREIHLEPEQAPLVTHRIALSLAELGDRSGAVAEWKALLEKWPGSAPAAEATYRLGTTLASTGARDAAREYLRKTIEAHADTEWAPLARIELGRTYDPLGTRDEAALLRGIAEWREFLRLHPSHEKAEEVAWLIGDAYFRFGRFDEAIEAFRSYLEKHPEGEHAPEAQVRVGLALYRKTDFDAAIAAYKAFLGRWPNHELWTQVQASIAAVTFAKGQHPLELWEKAKEAEKPGLLDRAERGFRAFLAEYPVDERAAQAQYLLGEIDHRRKDFAGAIEEWRIVASKYANRPEAAAALFRIAGTFESDLNDLPKAIETYEDLVARYPGSGEARAAARLLEQFRKKLLEVVTERASRTDEDAAIHVRTRNIDTLTIRAWPLNLEDRFRRRLGLSGLEQVAVEILPPVLEKTVLTDGYEKYRLFERDLALPELEGPGAWIVSVQDRDLTATTLVVISDLRIVTKTAPDQTLVFAVNERTGEPFPGVRVLLGAGGRVVTEGRTNGQGVYVQEGKTGSGEVSFFAESAGHVAFTDLAGAGGTSFGYTTKAYVYTDRPLYRPGHEVKVKGIYRMAADGAYVASGGEPLHVEIVDPRDTVVHREDVTTNDYGTFLSEVWLPDSAALGDYRIVVTNRQKQAFAGAFRVEEYRKPEFTITARTDRRAYLPGEEVKADVSLRYFFGGPVPTTTLRYTLWRGPFSFDPSEHDEFAWFTKDPERERARARAEAAGMEPVSEGELVTDADGNAELTFRAAARDEDARYVVTFEALDLNREWVRESASVIVTRQAYFAIAKTEKKVYRPDEKIDVRLTTVDALHFPVAAKGEVVVARRAFVGDRETESVVSRQDVMTGEDGRATASVKVDRPGEYRLKFVGTDRAGNAVIGGTVVTIAGEAEDLDRQAKVVASRQIYREGEEAEVLVNTPVAPAWALLTFEGERILDHRVVRLTERSTTLRLLMKPEDSPNIFVRIAIPAGGKLHEAGDEVYVFKYLQVDVAADRPEVKPGEKASYTITTTDQRGQPVSAEVSVAVVDSSILALRPDGTPQIKPFFYDQRRTHAVNTGSSYSFRYAGNTRETNRALLEEELRRQGREAFERTMRYVQGGKEFLARGDLENAAIEFRKALQVSPRNYEARELLDRVAAQLEMRRARERLDRLAEKLKDAKNEEFESEEQDGYAGKRPGAPSAAPAPERSESGRGWGGVGGGAAHEPAANPDAPAQDAAPADKEAAASKALGRFARDAQDQDARKKNDFGPVLGDMPQLGALFEAAPLVPARLRQRFADTAAWDPRVVTGADGKAHLEIELPDNLTTWRATARGVTKGTLVGEGSADVVARKDLLVRIDTPRFLTQKDRTTITGTVHNNLGQEVKVRLTLSGENVSLEGDGAVDETLRPRQIRAHDFRLATTGQGIAELVAKAETTVESDAAKTGIRVLPHGLRTIEGRSGEVTEEAVEVVTLPDGIVPGTRSFSLTLSPRIDGSILESLVWLGGYEYGCLEQTVNRFLPAVAARQALDAIGSPDAGTKDVLDRAVRRGLLALYSFQNGDGSFGWFSGGKGDPLMTAYGILGIERAREARFDVDEAKRQRALAAGRRLVKEAGDDGTKAFLLHALATAGAADLEDLNQVYRYRDGLDAFALANLALAMKDSGRGYNAVSLVNLLKPMAVRTGDAVHFEGASRRGSPNATETTAYAVRALLAVEPGSDLARDAVTWLMRTKRGPRWWSTRDTGAAVLALADWLVAKNVERNDYVVEVWVNEGEVPYQKIRVAGGEVAGDAERVVLLDGARLKTGENRIRIVKTGPGRLFYTMLASYVTEAEDIQPDGNLVKVDRRYTEYVSPVAAKEGKKEIEPGWTIVRPDARPKEDRAATIERAGSGDKFRVRIVLDAREPLSYVIVEDPLPAGVEVVEGQETGPFDRAERHDTKEVFFLSNVPAGKTELTYLVQAVHPGEYHALPATAYPMYEPAIHGRSGENRVTVVPESGVIGRPATPEGVTPDEIYGLAVRDFREERLEAARKGLETLLASFKLLDEYQTDCQAMLMRANFALGDHRKAVEAYERLVELNPRRGPKDREERRKLAVAYFEIGEFERALALLRGVVDEHFSLEAEVAETYRAIERSLRAEEYTTSVVRSYPDSNLVVETAWKNALGYLEMKRPATVDAPSLPGAIDAGLMLPEALEAFRAFLSHHPESPLADEADRMIVTVLNRMELRDAAAEEARRFLRRYQDSVHLDDVYYYLTETLFSQGDFEQALETGKTILERKFRTDPGDRRLVESPFVPHVTWLFAKIHHVKGDLGQAVELYRRVADRFEDARDALEFLTKEELSIPDAVSFAAGEKATPAVRRKNLESLELRIYPVDLMLLLALKKDLRDADDVDLGGIAPASTVRREFAGGRDYRWHEEEIPLGLDAPKGVYLVVARSGELSASSLVVVSDLDVTIQRVGPTVRVWAVDRKTHQPVGNVFVKISDGDEIRAQGFTDARGIFETRGLTGAVVVVAEKDGQYALVRR